jgi:uncharacterized protein
MKAELLAILCCPETHQGLAAAEAELINELNARVREGTLKNRVGKQVTEAFEGGLVRDDRKYLYLVRKNIPVMLIDEAIPLEGLTS